MASQSDTQNSTCLQKSSGCFYLGLLNLSTETICSVFADDAHVGCQGAGRERHAAHVQRGPLQSHHQRGMFSLDRRLSDFLDCLASNDGEGNVIGVSGILNPYSLCEDCASLEKP